MREAGQPDIGDKTKANEGTAAHWLAEEYVRAGGLNPNKPEAMVNALAPNGVRITDEMHYGAEQYARKVLNAHPSSDAAIYLEAKLQMALVHEKMFGTADALIHYTDGLIVGDYKYGRWPVGALSNYQLVSYYAGALTTLNIGPQVPVWYPVTLFIQQPRSNNGVHYTEWKTTAGELEPYVNKLKDSACKAFGPNPPAVPGEHCMFCKAKASCKELQATAKKSASLAHQVSPEGFDPVQLGRELAELHLAKGMLEHRITGLEAQAMEHIRTGGVIPGYAVERGLGRKAWTVAPKEVLSIGNLYGVDLRGKQEIVVATPAQALTKKLPENIVNQHSETPVRGLKLVKDTGESMAAKAFSQNKGT